MANRDSKASGTRWVWLAVLGALGCPPPSARDAPAVPPGRESAAPPSASTRATAPPPRPPIASVPPKPAVLWTSCASVGPLACNAAPSPNADLCKRNARCMLDRVATPRDFEGLDISPDPDAPPGKADAAGKRQAAPPGSGIESIAVMNVVAENDVGMIQSGATYLVAERPEGACLVDVIHDWDRRPSYVEVDLDAHWQPAGAGLRLDLRSRRILHEPLDESESASGVSDALSDACVSLAYDVVDGRFERVSRRSAPGACASVPH